MKTKNLLKFALSAAVVLTIGFTSCKKDEAPADQTVETTQTQLQQTTADDAELQSSSDDAVNDANDAVSKGTAKDAQLYCNMTITTDSTATIGVNDTITYTVTFNGLNCKGNRNRTGVIKIKRKFGEPWSTQNASIRIIFESFKITKVSNNKSITFNGSKIIKNLSGGVIRKLGTSGYQSEVKHSIKGYGLTASFDNGTARTWNVDREVTYSGNYSLVTANSDLSVKNEGKGSTSSYSNLAFWGVNRNGENFYTRIEQPIMIKQSCNWNPVSGKKIHYNGDKTVTLTFGYKNNAPVTGTDCPTQFKVDWVKGTYSGSFYGNL